MQEFSDRYVELRGGLCVPIEPIQLLLRLEAMGFTFEREGLDRIAVRPFSKLVSEDVAQIKRWKLHLIALLDYAPPVGAF
jgi:hypothetical protein